jgi:hypothetical protein
MHFSGVNWTMDKNILHCGKSKKQGIKAGHNFNNFRKSAEIDVKIMAYKLSPFPAVNKLLIVFFEWKYYSIVKRTQPFIFFNKGI